MKEMGLRSSPAPFLTKTYMMVDDEGTNEVISWGEGGTTFVVWQTAEFAKDLLPTYFKHNNFSSFVRQLNTYGFRKIVPDKWEFANDNFKRGEKGLLAEIRRRKASASEVPTGKVSGRNPSQASSGEEAGSSSTSSPESKNPGSMSVERADLSGENEKLRRNNEMLSEELAQARKHCDELMTFLTGYLKVGPDQINQIMRQEMVVGDDDDDDDDDEKDKESSRKNKKMEEGSLKLFGVWLNQGKKRGRCCESDNSMGLSGAQHGGKVMKTR